MFIDRKLCTSDPPQIPCSNPVAAEELTALPDVQVTTASHIVTRMRDEIRQTEDTSVAHPVELGWLGNISHCSSTHSQLVRCSSCLRLILSSRVDVHKQQCDPSTSVQLRQHQEKLASATPGKKNTNNGKVSKKGAGKSQFDNRFPTKLCKVSYPYQPGVSMVDDFMEGMVGYIGFPMQCKRKRSTGLSRYVCKLMKPAGCSPMQPWGPCSRACSMS